MPNYPDPPKHLSISARSWWRKIMKECDGLEDSQLLVLQGGLEAYDMMKDAQKELKDNGGLTIMDRFGQPKPHPAATIVRDSRAAVLSAYKALGLDLDYGVGD